MFAKIRTFAQAFASHLRQFQEKHAHHTPRYRLIEINTTKDEEHIVTIQIAHKNAVFRAKPEELLADDHLVNNFSPIDVRTLTYLGYLGINGPQYKILAQRLSKQDKIVFALKKKGDKNILLKTADELMKEKDIIEKLSGQDANLIGYVTAAENIQAEKVQKEKILNQASSYSQNISQPS